MQTKNDTAMVIRMFEYGFSKAKELSKYKKAEEIVIYIPKQLVIFIEQNRNIKDTLKMKLIFPDGQDKIYGEDLHKVLLAINNLFEYLNRKYGDNEQLEKKVFAMTKTLYDPVIEKKWKSKEKKS